MIDETAKQIEEMGTQSASIVAVKAAEALRELADREYHTVEEFTRSVVRNSRTLQQANHSHASLYTTQQRIIDEVTDPEPGSVEAGKERLLDVIETVVGRIESSKDRAAERAAELLADGDVVLTHENSSTVVRALERALEDGKRLDLYVTESRPRYIGRRTVRHFADSDGVDVTLIVDSAAGHYLPECDRVLIGMNCIIDDTVYNRVGTYPIVSTAANEDVPVTVVGSAAKFIGGGFEFRNKFRPASEVIREPVEGFEVGNPGYDETPTRLLDSVVTEDGVMEF